MLFTLLQINLYLTGILLNFGFTKRKRMDKFLTLFEKARCFLISVCIVNLYKP